MIKIYKNNTEIGETLYSGLEETTIQLNTTDALYIGYYKPLNQLYASLKTVNSITSRLNIQRSTASGYEDAVNIDQTRGFKRSNFITINKTTNQAAKVEPGKGTEALHWIKITVTANTSSMVLRLLDILFSSEDDLLTIFRDANRFYPALMDSHILALIEARNLIVRKINNSGAYKYNGVDLKTFTAWDFLDINDVRDAANYIAAASVLGEIQDSSGDVFREKSDIFYKKGWALFDVFNQTIIKLDENDDGVVDPEETIPSHITFWK